MTAMPQIAMVLAAGLGKRMRPLTNTMPKPLVPVAGRPLIDHVLDRIEAAGIGAVVVNAHYLAPMLIDHLGHRERPLVAISREASLLDTGGGVRHALGRLGDHFFVVNSDVFWLDGKVGALTRLARAWRDADTDALLLMQRTSSAVGYEGAGDYFLDPAGLARRRGEREVAPYLFAGVQILHRRLFDGIEDEAFSLNRLYDRAQEAGRLRGIVHDGEWYHIGTPESLAESEQILAWHRLG